MEEISELLERSIENVQEALQRPLTRGQAESMEKYLLPVKVSRRGAKNKKRRN